MLADVNLNTSNMPWREFGGGIDFKTLRTSPETGTWSVLFRCRAGSSFRPHRHLGGGEYLVIKGCMHIRGGAQEGGVTARDGDYGYEPNGVLHDQTDFVEETVLFFTNDGPLQFLTDDLKPDFVLDVTMIEELSASAPIAA
ncbi:MAG: anti-sigma factor ChrR (cupin superfamily) [Gammaproteobacteria bacterium]|jgi:anti-sigma factor ChrR (cupin superfamily)